MLTRCWPKQIGRATHTDSCLATTTAAGALCVSKSEQHLAEQKDKRCRFNHCIYSALQLGWVWHFSIIWQDKYICPIKYFSASWKTWGKPFVNLTFWHLPVYHWMAMQWMNCSFSIQAILFCLCVFLLFLTMATVLFCSHLTSIYLYICKLINLISDQCYFSFKAMLS